MLLGKTSYNIRYCSSGRLTVTENGEQAKIEVASKTFFLV